jgi:protein phosphatase
MGTTVTVLALLPDVVVASNVGDSRIYLVRDGQIERLSVDHTLVAEQVELGIMNPEDADTSPLRHVLTRNLGSSEDVNVAISEIVPFNNDRYILCTDGLTDLVTDEEILNIVESRDNPEELCQNFVEEALKRGGHDNTTVVSIFVSGIKRTSSTTAAGVGSTMVDMFTGVKKVMRKLKP